MTQDIADAISARVLLNNDEQEGIMRFLGDVRRHLNQVGFTIRFDYEVQPK